MAKQIQKERAIVLRKQGTSIKDIAKKLSVSSSTVSVWCRDIPLSERAINVIAKNGNEKAITALMMYSEKKRTLRKENELESASIGAKKTGTLSKRDIYCIGLGLYWGEGYKRGSQEFGFTNSDAAMVKFYIKWLEITFSVKLHDLILRVSVNDSHKQRADLIVKYWSRTLSVPESQFTKTSLIKTRAKKVYQNYHEHMGTLRIKVRRGTSMRREVLGAINSIS